MDQNYRNKNEQKPQIEQDPIKNDEIFSKEQNNNSFNNQFQNQSTYMRHFLYDPPIPSNQKEMFNLYNDYHNQDRGDLFNMCDGQSYVQNIFKSNNYEQPYMGNINFFQQNLIGYQNYNNNFYTTAYDQINSPNNIFKDMKGIKNQQPSQKIQTDQRIPRNKNRQLEYIDQKSYEKTKRSNIPFIEKKIGGLTKQQRKAKIKLYLQKRQKRTYTKKVSYDCRKKVADQRIRVKGRFVTKQQAIKYLELGPQQKQEYSVQQIKKMLIEKFAKKQESELKNQLQILSQKIKIQ